MSTSNKKITFKSIMSNPIVLLISIGLGIFSGLFLGKIKLIDIIAELYMKALQMCVIPIVCGAVAVNIGALLSEHFRPILKKLILSALIVLLFSSVLGAFTGYGLKSFLAPDSEMTEALSRLQNDGEEEEIVFEEVSFYESVDEVVTDETQEYSVIDFLLNIIPDNIFQAFTAGEILKIIFFFSILGVMLMLVDKSISQPIVKALDGIYQVFVKFINFLLSFLPIGMFSILQSQFSTEGMVDILKPLVKLVLAIYIVCIAVIIVVFFVIQIKTKTSVKNHIKAISRTFFLCIGTSSCIASLSVALEDSIKYFKLNEKVTKSFMPIGITMIQSGVIATTSLVSVFAAILYDVPLGFNTMAIIIVGSIFYGFSVIGVPGLVAATMMSIVLTPLGIPSAIIAILMMAIVMFFDPIAVFSSVYSNIGIAACIIPREEGEKPL